MATLSIKNDAVTEVAQLLIDPVGTDEVATSKITLGAAGVNDGFVSSANPLPVVAALPTGASTAAKQDTEIASLASIDTKTPALGQALAAASVPVVLTAAQLSTLTPTAGLTDAQLRATAVPVSGPLTDAEIRATALPVSAASLPLPTGAASAANQTTELASLASIDGKITAVNTGAVVVSSSALPSGASTAAKQPALGTAGAASADVITVQGIASMTALKTDGSAVTQPVSGPLTDAQLRATAVPVSGPLTDTELRATAVPVSLASVPSHAVTNAGTFAVQAASAGDVAHDSADSGNPVKVGAKATASVAGETLVAAADRTNLLAGTDGVLLVRNGYSLEDIVQERTTNTDGAATAFASGLSAPGAGVRLYIKKITISNSSASFCTVDLRDGVAGSVLWTCPVPATGGIVENFDPPLKLTANTALAFDASAATSTISISGSGFKSKV